MELEQELHHCRVELERLGGRKSQVRGQQSEGGNFVNNGRQKMASSVYELVKTSVTIRGHYTCAITRVMVVKELVMR